MKTGVCDKCEYWQKERHEQNGEYGICRRFPPVIVGFESRQPRTWKFAVCGEFEEREAK